MKKNRSRADIKRRRTIHWLIFLEIVFMAVGVACVMLPLRWRVLTLIVLGAREIIMKAHARLKQTDKLEGEIKVDYGKENEKTVRGKADGRTEKQKDKTRAEKRGKQKLEGGETLKARSKGRE